MWFKNLICFAIDASWQPAQAELETQIAAHPARPCSSLEMETLGFSAPLGTDDRLLHAAPPWWLLETREFRKLLPAAVIRELLDERVELIKEREGRDVGRKERQNLKEEVVHDALPKAFSQSRTTTAMLSPKLGWLWVDASSASRAERFAEALREATGSLPIRPLQPALAPEDILTAWLQSGDLPPGLALGDRCELVGPAPESATVRYSRHALDTEEVLAHLREGKRVTKLGLVWQDRLEFDLTADLELKRLKFLDVVTDEVDDEDALLALQSSMTLMGATLVELLEQVLPAMGAVPDRSAPV